MIDIKIAGIIDLNHVVCGLVPEIVKNLNACEENTIRFFIRQGIELEMQNSFGSGGIWNITFENDFGKTLLTFSKKTDAELNNNQLNKLQF